jgi:hypothetical protein
MRMVVGAGDSPLAPGKAGASEVAGLGDGRSLLELVLSLAQVQYEMESRRRGGQSNHALRAVEGQLVEELHRRGVSIPQRTSRPPRSGRLVTPGRS